MGIGWYEAYYATPKAVIDADLEIIDIENRVIMAHQQPKATN